MTDDLKRLFRRWASLPSGHHGAVNEALGQVWSHGGRDAAEFLEEAARVGAELEAEHAQEIARSLADNVSDVMRVGR